MTCDEHDWSLAHVQLAGSDKGGYLAALITYYAFVSPLTEPQHLSGGTIAIVVGVAGALYGGLGVGQAVQNAMDTVWAVPRHKRPDPIRSRPPSSGSCCSCSGRPTIFSAEMNAVAVDHLYPRALPAPFTDDVSLTAGDRKTYTGQAKAQQAKGFERIEVTFHPETEKHG